MNEYVLFLLDNIKMFDVSINNMNDFEEFLDYKIKTLKIIDIELNILQNYINNTFYNVFKMYDDFIKTYEIFNNNELKDEEENLKQKITCMTKVFCEQKINYKFKSAKLFNYYCFKLGNFLYDYKIKYNKNFNILCFENDISNILIKYYLLITKHKKLMLLSTHMINIINNYGYIKKKLETKKIIL